MMAPAIIGEENSMPTEAYRTILAGVSATKLNPI